MRAIKPISIGRVEHYSNMDEDMDDLPSPIPRTPEHVRIQHKLPGLDHDEIVVPNHNHSFHSDKYLGKFVQNISNSLEHSNLQNSGSIYKKVLKLTFGNILAEEINRKRALKKEKEKKRANFFKIFSGKKKSPRSLPTQVLQENEEILRSHFQHWKVETVLKSIGKGFHLTKLRRNYFYKWKNTITDEKNNIMVLRDCLAVWKLFLVHRIRRKMSVAFCNQKFCSRFFYKWIRQFIHHQKCREKQEKEKIIQEYCLKRHWHIWMQFIEEEKEKKEFLHLAFDAWKDYLSYKRERQQQLLKALDKQVDIVQSKYFNFWKLFTKNQKDRRIVSYYFSQLCKYYHKSKRQSTLLLETFDIMKKTRVFSHWINKYEMNKRLVKLSKENTKNVMIRIFDHWRSAFKTNIYLRRLYFSKWKEYIQYSVFKSQIQQSGSLYVVKRCFKKLSEYVQHRRRVKSTTMEANAFAKRYWIKKWNLHAKIHMITRKHNAMMKRNAFEVLTFPLASYRRRMVFQQQADYYCNQNIIFKYWSMWIHRGVVKNRNEKMRDQASTFFKCNIFKTWRNRAKLQRQLKILQKRNSKWILQSHFVKWKENVQLEKSDRTLHYISLARYFTNWKKFILDRKILHQREKQLHWRYMYRITRTYFKNWITVLLQVRNKKRQSVTQERVKSLQLLRDCFYLWNNVIEGTREYKRRVQFFQIKKSNSLRKRVFDYWLKNYQLCKAENQLYKIRNRKRLVQLWNHWRSVLEDRETIITRKSIYFVKWVQKYRAVTLKDRFEEATQQRDKAFYFYKWKNAEYQKYQLRRADVYFAAKRIRCCKISHFHKWYHLLLKQRRLSKLADQITQIREKNLKFKMFYQFKSTVHLLQRRTILYCRMIKHIQSIKKEKIWMIWKCSVMYRVREREYISLVLSKVFVKWRCAFQKKREEDELLVRKLTHQRNWSIIMHRFGVWKRKAQSRIHSLHHDSNINQPQQQQEEEEDTLNRTSDSITMIHNILQTIQSSNSQRWNVISEQKQKIPSLPHHSTISTRIEANKPSIHSISESIDQFIYFSQEHPPQPFSSNIWNDTLLSKWHISSLSKYLDDLNK